MALCLIVEDDPGHRRLLSASLRHAGHEVTEVATGTAAKAACRDDRPEVVLLDLGLPDADGLDLLPRLLELSPLSRVVVLTGENDVSTAVRALRGGARHYLVKPWDREELLVVVEREALTVDRLESTRRDDQPGAWWGETRRVAALLASVDRLATSPWTPVLLRGETGTGKEVLARRLHSLSSMEGSFVPLNCAAVPESLQESEIFGHEVGAFTGAASRRRGVVELAREGTLFLDEIGEMPPSRQAQMLRFLEEGTYRRVGGEKELSSRCRVVAATHRDLEAMVAEGRFREDLLFRLGVVQLTVPPLREREGDILPLAHHLLQALSSRLGRPVKPLTAAAELALASHEWPGNVRELRNRIERALVLGDDGPLDVEDLGLALERAPRLEGRREPTAAALRKVLDGEGWVVARAARRLGVPRHWLRYRMEHYGLKRKS